ncbi:DUF1489 family protein [Rhizosaccharibacter radicis]|uniref:DUF1489 domain-containing protein n=1 Tax=Rhizosaccharibacter radicis TaxID=2782605 RepID=A0ABT1VSE6_9PROT|nr:DUF1489 domain-containing protein [Acetobacteraceae bacterium KSS12]
MLHLIKLAVGATGPEDLAERQAVRAREVPFHEGLPFFRTRSFPRRHAEILAGGSIFWVIGGLLLCRQEIAAIVEDKRDDGTPCTGVRLHPPVIPVTPRAVRPFQGWRYLTVADAPSDLARGNAARGDEVLPPRLRRELVALCLL